MWMILKVVSNCTEACISLFFPQSCFVCHNQTQKHESICIPCLSSFSKAIDSPHPFITSIFSFKDPFVKKSIHAIKYFHRKDLILPFATILHKEIVKKDTATPHVLIPIPMPKLRRYVRGYNHCEVLAKEIAKNTRHIVRTDILLRNPLTATKRQVSTTSRKQRLQNQRNAFSVQKDVRGLHILLIDDVTTTGATLVEARRKLLDRGAAYVEAFTIAH